MIYIVLGMHKSGTTLTAQLLHGSGINMGFDLNDGEEDYGAEKCEGRLLREINNSLLGSKGVFSLDVDVPQHFLEQSLNAERIGKLIEAQSSYPDWGMKNPIQTLTYSFWESRLPEHKLILVFRSPESVAKHYIRSRPGYKVYWRALATWKQYNQQILKLLSEVPAQERILINYDRMLKDDSEFKRLEKFVGKPLIDQRRKTKSKPAKFKARFKPLLLSLSGSQKLMRELQDAHAKDAVIHTP